MVLFTKLIQQNTSKVGKFVIMSDDNTNEPNDLSNDTLNYDDPHRPWTMWWLGEDGSALPMYLISKKNS